MLTNADTKYWTPNPQMLEKVDRHIAAGLRVLEVGPGAAPFSRATYFVDWHPGKNTVVCDLCRDRLPFADKEFDFVYCRHVLEDMYNPFLACDEMSRVAKAGYIETPSPLSEVCRGIDGNSPSWRGYVHHRYLVWAEAKQLCFLAKYPFIEYLCLSDDEIANILRKDAFLWNSYYFWEGRIDWRLLQHEVDYTLGPEYKEAILKAVDAGVRNANEISAA
ncbi:MAG: hypothetical protein B9S32_00005 [Verrucomicrobia bacterium Tous-C9LFEB]|nr:MAG: hypothetical protein B9S32_00005 [Verrucomicrobia bacterium Tous-C9LFEB]